MTGLDPKQAFKRYLQDGRETMLWKLDGLSEYEIRRPMTPTGTNLLGLVKHLIGIEVGYLGHTFGRPFDEPLPWLAATEPNVDMWATPDESRDQIVDLYGRACRHSDTTVDELDLDTTAAIPQWPEDRRQVTLHQILVHVTAETHRHAGHADIARELIDGAAGLLRHNDNLPAADRSWWETYRERLERAAVQASQQPQ